MILVGLLTSLSPSSDQEVPQTLKDKRQEVVDTFKKLQSETEPILKIFVEPEVTRQIQNSRDSKQLLEYLTKNHNFEPRLIDVCFNYAKFQFECGNYSGRSRGEFDSPKQ